MSSGQGNWRPRTNRLRNVHARMKFAVAIFVHAVDEYGHLALRPEKDGHRPHP